MPVLMNKTDWTATLEKARKSNRVWRQHISGKKDENLLALPASGSFDVIFVEVAPNVADAHQPDERKKPRISDFIGYGAKFHKLRPTEEWMKELREGEKRRCCGARCFS